MQKENDFKDDLLKRLKKKLTKKEQEEINKDATEDGIFKARNEANLIATQIIENLNSLRNEQIDNNLIVEGLRQHLDDSYAEN